MSDNVVPDGTLRGYIDKHGRPPAFGGVDGALYSVDMLINTREEDAELQHAFGGALLFVQWSPDGAQPVQHLETEYLYQSDSRVDVKDDLGELTLAKLKEYLDRLIEARSELPDW